MHAADNDDRWQFGAGERGRRLGDGEQKGEELGAGCRGILVLVRFKVKYVAGDCGFLIGYFVSGEDPAFGFWPATVVYGVKVSGSDLGNAFCRTGCLLVDFICVYDFCTFLMAGG